MDLIKILLHFVVWSLVTLAVNGCGRLKCYKCNSQDSPATCGESNFDASTHAEDTVSGSILKTITNGGTSCIRGWAQNQYGVYYYRDKSNEQLWDGCKTPWMCACNDDLCNSRGSHTVYLASVAATVLFCFSVTTVVNQILI